MFPADLDEWAWQHGEPEAVGPQARMNRYGNGYDEREEEEDDEYEGD